MTRRPARRERPGAAPAARRLRRGARALLDAYALVLFGRGAGPGLLFLAATLVVPAHGVAGLLGLAATEGWARLLRRPAAHLADGYYAFNGLLVGLGMGLYFRMSLPFVGLLLVAALLTVALAAALRHVGERYLGVPMLSLPFVLVTWAALLSTSRFSALELTVDPVLATRWAAGVLPASVELYLRSLGACFFQLNVPAGALVLVGLLLMSRWAAALSVLGYAAGLAVYTGLGGAPSDLSVHFVGLNFIVTAIAVGGVFVVLSPASLLLSVAAAALTAFLAAALLAGLAGLGLPVLSAPLVVAIQLVLFALLTRVGPASPRLVAGVPGLPEENLRRAVYGARRYPDPAVPVLFLPVHGRWTVTQGPDGRLTHVGLWAHAWDLEVHDDGGAAHRGQGARNEDYLCWGLPVVAPADGRVVRVVGHLEDSPVGEVDVANNWGNLVILWHHGDVYSAVCHLQRGSVAVSEGQAVVRGQVLGRVGSSGRSPVPHLHFQVQATADIGAPTRYAELLHYVVGGPGGRRYVTHGVPAEGEAVAAMPLDDTVRRALALPPGRTLTWRVQAGDRTREEAWVSTIGPLGERRLATDDGRASLTFYADDHYTTLLDYEGPGDALLGLFFLGAARVPYLADPDVTWEDAPAGTAFLSRARRLATDLALPFAAVGAVPTRSRVEAAGGGVRVVTDLDPAAAGAAGRLPDRIVVDLVPGEGPVRLEATLAGAPWLLAEVAP